MKTYKLQVVIFLSFLALFLLIVTGLVVYGYKSNSEIMLKTSDELLYQISETIIKQTSNHLDPAQKVGKVLRQVIEQDKKSFEELIQNFTSFSLESLDTYPQLSSIYFGDENGNYIMARHMINGNFAIKKMLRTPDLKEASETEITHNREVLEIRDVDKSYDPRNRPWYIKAKTEGNVIWTPEYQLFTEQTMGVTCSHPVYNAQNKLLGVIGIDFILKDISDFMRSIKIGESGTAFIIDLQGKILAHPSLIANKKHNRNSDNQLVLSPPIQIAMKQYMEKRQLRFTFEINGERFIASFRPFPENIGYNWALGIIVPEDDFVGPIARIHETSLLFSFWLLIIAGFLTAAIARELTDPMNKLTDEVVQIKNLNFDRNLNIKSSVTEIQTMVDAVASMKTVLGSFSKFVPSELIHELMKGGQEASVTVKPAKITLMFTDIANFSAITEKSDPNALVKQLEEYFDALSGIIYKHNGVIDKYIGDSVMAIWGAPTKDEKQAYNACLTALEIQETLKVMNDKWQSEGKAVLKTRIGIHTGVSLVGNFGSSKRLNYTAIGDNVNLASRLEGLNKFYNTGIILSDETRQEASNEFLYRPVDLVTVKGREQSSKIYTIIDIVGNDEEKNIAGKELSNLMESALYYYINREWNDAIRVFENIKKIVPDDFIASLFIDRITKLKQNPPDDNWDGVFNVKSK